MKINEKIDQLKEVIEDYTADIADIDELCVYAIRIYWREDESGYYPDVEIDISNKFKPVPKPKNK